MSPGRPRAPDRPAVSSGAVRALLAVAAFAPALGLVRGSPLLLRSGGNARPTLRPQLKGISPVDQPGTPALRPRSDLEREARPFILWTRSVAERRRAVQCLANAVYYEAALEPLEGQRAVAQVVLNRVRDADFPRSICGVVYQGWARPTGCQFSFTCNGALGRAPSPAIYAQARRVAEAALDGYVMAAVGRATHYHAAAVDPWWRRTLARMAQVGAHIFYAWTPTSHGSVGQAYGGGELRLPQAVIDGRVPRGAPSPASPPSMTQARASYPVGSESEAGGARRLEITSSGEAQDQPSSAILAVPALKPAT